VNLKKSHATIYYILVSQVTLLGKLAARTLHPGFIKSQVAHFDKNPRPPGRVQKVVKNDVFHYANSAEPCQFAKHDLFHRQNYASILQIKNSAFFIEKKIP
jgi:hypothetical protein